MRPPHVVTAIAVVKDRAETQSLADKIIPNIRLLNVHISNSNKPIAKVHHAIHRLECNNNNNNSVNLEDTPTTTPATIPTTKAI